MLFDLSMALRLRHDLYKVAATTLARGLVETWVPLGLHRPGSRPSPTSGSGLPRRPADLSVGSTDLVGGPHDLLKTLQKIPRTT
jgi:hypothetical protein